MRFIYIFRNAAWIYCNKPERRPVSYHSEHVRLFQGYLSLAVRRHRSACQLFREIYIKLIYKFPYRKCKIVTLRLCLSIQEKAVLKTKEKICICTFITLNITGQAKSAQYWDDSGRKNFRCKTQLQEVLQSLFSMTILYYKTIAYLQLSKHTKQVKHCKKYAEKLLVNNVNNGLQDAPTTHRKYLTTAHYTDSSSVCSST